MKVDRERGIYNLMVFFCDLIILKSTRIPSNCFPKRLLTARVLYHVANRIACQYTSNSLFCACSRKKRSLFCDLLEADDFLS